MYSMKYFIALFLLFFSTSSYADSAYDRVMKSGKMRCGYFIEAPFTLKDPNTGALSGMSVDITNKIAQELGLEIDWVEEINFATFPQDLKSRRYDAVCGDLFILPRGAQTDYTDPYIFVSVYGYVKTGNTAFDKPFDTIDWSKVSI